MTDTTIPSAFTLNTEVDPAEPRVRDLDVAERLGMKNPHDIRRLIEENREELETYGSFSALSRNPTKRGGRPGREYWLNEGQALLIATLSRAEKAPAVRRLLITSYQAARSGHPASTLSLPAPTPAEPPFCTGCAMKEWWLDPDSNRNCHPLKDGPLNYDDLLLLSSARTWVSTRVREERARLKALAQARLATLFQEG